MPGTFEINSRARAKRLFPKRLIEVAAPAHGYSLDDTYGINADIAARVGVTEGAVSRWMSGSLPRISTLLAIADAYSVDPGWLVGNGEEEPHEFASEALAARMPYETLTKVLRIMSEVRRDAGEHLSDERFADVSVAVMQMVERDPGMPEYAITGAAYRLIKNGSSL